MLAKACVFYSSIEETSPSNKIWDMPVGQCAESVEQRKLYARNLFHSSNSQLMSD